MSASRQRVTLEVRIHHINTTWPGKAVGGYWRHVESGGSFWRELIRQQKQSGISVREFCRQHQASEPGFYAWRKRLAKELAVKFALVETKANGCAEAAAVEITLATGERLRVGPGVGGMHFVLGVKRPSLYNSPAAPVAQRQKRHP